MKRLFGWNGLAIGIACLTVVWVAVAFDLYKQYGYWWAPSSVVIPSGAIVYLLAYALLKPTEGEEEEGPKAGAPTIVLVQEEKYLTVETWVGLSDQEVDELIKWTGQIPPTVRQKMCDCHRFERLLAD